MRLITFIVAIIAAGAPAGAQDWREYEYPNEGFTVAFPAEPKVETTSYQASGRRLVEARVYSVVQEGRRVQGHGRRSVAYRDVRRQRHGLCGTDSLARG